MKIILVDRNRSVVSQWQALRPDTEAHCCDIFDVRAGAVVSPANSFGFMDGGIDAVYTEKFGTGVQRTVQSAIKARFAGELLVGQAFAVPTGSEHFPQLIVAPTMRVPMTIADPSAVRLATRAAIRCAMNLRIDAVVLPGMGTGAGELKPDWAARMMIAGIEDALFPRPFPSSWQEAHTDHFKPYE